MAVTWCGRLTRCRLLPWLAPGVEPGLAVDRADAGGVPTTLRVPPRLERDTDGRVGMAVIRSTGWVWLRRCLASRAGLATGLAVAAGVPDGFTSPPMKLRLAPAPLRLTPSGPACELVRGAANDMRCDTAGVDKRGVS